MDVLASDQTGRTRKVEIRVSQAVAMHRHRNHFRNHGFQGSLLAHHHRQRLTVLVKQRCDGSLESTMDVAATDSNLTNFFEVEWAVLPLAGLL